MKQHCIFAKILWYSERSIIIELESMFSRIESLEGNTCLNILELALDVEYAAFDLYRSIAEKTEDNTVRSALLTIAQAEKGHMKNLVRAITQCPDLPI